MPNQEPVTNVSDPRWLRAISHPIRIRLLAMLEDDAASPVLLAGKLDQPLGTVAYHIRTLYDLGLLELVKTRQRRGATEHYYRTTARPRSSAEEWEQLDGVSKQRLLTALIAKATDSATRSAAAGGFDSAEAHISTTAVTLDDEGWRTLASEVRQWLARVEAIERESANRLAKQYDGAINVGVTLMAFEALPFRATAASDGEIAAA